MNASERGFLLLSSSLGNPERKPLSPYRLRQLSSRYLALPSRDEEKMLEPRDLLAIGFDQETAERIAALLSEETALDRYLKRAAQVGCVPITRANPEYPLLLRKRLGQDSPGCLWIKGDRALLECPAVSLVGSRDLGVENDRFAREAGRQAALQGYILVSGNARGADSAAQQACLDAGGKVISVVADELCSHREAEGILYVSEEDYDAPFSPQRALSRNRVIHALGMVTVAAQCTLGKGGTWNGSTGNLRHGWSPLYLFRDGSEASLELERMGAETIGLEELEDYAALAHRQWNLFDSGRWQK